MFQLQLCISSWRQCASLAILFFFIPFCASQNNPNVYATRFPGVTWDNDNWLLTTTTADPGHYQSRASVANGYLGISVASLGPFFEADSPVDGDGINGWPLFDRRQSFATVSGFYDVQPETNRTNFEWLNQLGGESVISGIPHWSGLLVDWQGQVLDASTDLSQISNFQSSLDIKSALLDWSYTWTPSGGPALDVHYSMFAHKLYVNQVAVQLSLSASTNATVTVLSVHDGDGALRFANPETGSDAESQTIWSAVQPLNIPYVTAFIYSKIIGDCEDIATVMPTQESYLGTNTSSIAQSATVSLGIGVDSTVVKYVGIASTDAFQDPQAIAKTACNNASSTGFDALLQSHKEEWKTILPSDSVDDYTLPGVGQLPNSEDIIEQQIQAVTNPFGLLQQTIGPNAVAVASTYEPLNANSIPVSGLVSDSYGGLVFWDSEVWMAPGLVVAFPEATKQIANYRVAKYPQALRNTHAREAATSSQANTSFSPNAAIYPWTSGRFGNCTGTGPCFDYEYHINGDIFLALENYYFVTGDIDTFREQLFPVCDSVAQVYSDLLQFNGSIKRYTLRNGTDPDEYANFVDNPAYTMVLIKTRLEMANMFRSMFGLPANDTWNQQADLIEIPTNENADIILEYAAMNGSIQVKQADAVLVDDLLDYQNPYTLSDLDYYAGKQSIEGPGMTYGVFSIVASEASPSGCAAYTYDLYGSQPYARAPWYQYSEQLIDDYNQNGGTHPAFPFLTGMGGANRVAIFGYLGLRLRIDSFNVDPSLPPQIPSLTYRTIYWQGHPVKASANLTHTTLARPSGMSSLANSNTEYALPNPIPVTVGYSPGVYNLTGDQPLVIANRRPDLNKTVAGNIAQCMPASSSTNYAPGQFPFAAVDGAVSTAWRPALANMTATMTVELGDTGIVPIRGFLFDWAQAPPKSYSVAFSNSSDASQGDVRNVASEDSVVISMPYDASRAALIQPYASNTTVVDLGVPVWGGRYAMLTIEGTQGTALQNGTGASVAEWTILPVQDD